MAHVTRKREAVDHDRSTRIEHADEIADQAVGMNGYVAVHFFLALVDSVLKRRTSVGDFPQPWRPIFLLKFTSALICRINHLPQHELWTANDGPLGGHVAADA